MEVRMHTKKMRSLQKLKKSLTKCQMKDFVGYGRVRSTIWAIYSLCGVPVRTVF
jgi:hypothetical protein